MERFFPKERIILTGNPVRQDLEASQELRDEAFRYFNLDPTKPTVLVIGGSLGARTINESVLHHLSLIRQQQGLQFLWQTGKYYRAAIAADLERLHRPDNLHVQDFISDMATAYAAADLVISRAGAGSISEFCLLGKPVILVPSPNVAEDHQTKNALALVNKDAAVYVAESDAPRTLLPTAINLAADDAQLRRLADNIRLLARPKAADDIAAEVIRLAESHTHH
jgi:UDP-N-acetylglucosamine--N-acetylmuramyl-(pentapeptide) pyrophosphoryl-undecaprenol N-acetylglucosamine transferase